MKHLLLKVFKIAAGSCLAILAAYALGLEYAVAAGIITLLTLQNTKKETLYVAGKRIAAFFISYILIWVLFPLMDYQVIAFGCFLFLFAGICIYFQMTDAVAINAVLATHYMLSKTVSLQMFLNEGTLLLIGVLIGILLNLYIPANVNQIREKQTAIEVHLKEILTHMARLLEEENKTDLDPYDIEDFHLQIKKGIEHSYQNMNNTFFQENRYFIDYMEMRDKQYYILSDMYEKIMTLTMVTSQSLEVADFFRQIAGSISESNNTKGLLVEHARMQDRLKRQELPSSREEFENRAILYMVSMNARIFLRMKKTFIDQLSTEQKTKYWGDVAD